MGAFTAVNRRAHTQATAYTIPADKVIQACKLAVKLPVPEKTNFWVSVSPGASCKYINTIAKRLAALNPGTVQAKWKSALDAAASNDNDNAMAAGNTLLYVHYVISMCHCPPPTWPDGVFVTSDGFAGPAAHIATAGKTLADTISSGVAAAIAVAQVALDEATALKPAVGAAPGDVGLSLEAQMQAAVAAQEFTLAASLLAQLQGQPATVAATPAKSLEAQVQEAAAKGDFTLVASLIAQISAQGAGAGANLDPAATVGGGGGAMSHENQVLALDRQIATASSAKQFAEALRLQKKQSDLRLVIGWEASKTQAVAESRFQDAAAFAHKIDLTLNPGTAEDDRLPRLRADLESAASAADYASCQRLSLEIAAIEGGPPSTAPAPGAGAESVAAVLAQMQSEIASLQSLKSLKRAVAPEVTITGTLPTAGSQDAGLQAALAASMLQGGGAVGQAPVSQAVMTADDMYFQGRRFYGCVPASGVFPTLSHPFIPDQGPNGLLAMVNETHEGGKVVASRASDSLAVRKYAAFCVAYGIPQPTGLVVSPAEIDSMCWVVYMAKVTKLSPGYCQAMLYGLAALFVAYGHPNPTKVPGTRLTLPRLWSTIRSIKKSCSKPRRERLPITTPIVKQMVQWMRSKAVGALGVNADMFCACFTTCTYGMLRQGEATAPGVKKWDPAVHAGVDDVTMVPSEQKFKYKIKASKMDFCRWGQEVELFATGTVDCPVDNMDRYLQRRRHQGPGPLFVYKDGTFLTRSRLVKALRTALQGCGYDQDDFSTHSFRRGGCTSLAAAGVPKLQIGYIGRWTSDALERYLQIPVNVRRSAALGMAAVSAADVQARGANGDRAVVEAACAVS